jgi:hypothetical protein
MLDPWGGVRRNGVRSTAPTRCPLVSLSLVRSSACAFSGEYTCHARPVVARSSMPFLRRMCVRFYSVADVRVWRHRSASRPSSPLRTHGRPARPSERPASCSWTEARRRRGERSRLTSECLGASGTWCVALCCGGSGCCCGCCCSHHCSHHCSPTTAAAAAAAAALRSSAGHGGVSGYGTFVSV